MGITYDDKGVVEEVRPDSQARAKRIVKGYQIVKVGTGSYSRRAVREAENGGAEYEATFQVNRCHPSILEAIIHSSPGMATDPPQVSLWSHPERTKRKIRDSCGTRRLRNLPLKGRTM